MKKLITLHNEISAKTDILKKYSLLKDYFDYIHVVDSEKPMQFDSSLYNTYMMYVSDALSQFHYILDDINIAYLPDIIPVNTYIILLHRETRAVSLFINMNYYKDAKKIPIDRIVEKANELAIYHRHAIERKSNII